MAYIVGSASISIVPDFKNAQIAITKFFNKQRDELKIPVDLDIDENKARAAGKRVGEAMSEGMANSRQDGDRLAEEMARGRAQAFTRAHAEALKANDRLDRESLKNTRAIAEQRRRIFADEIARTSAARNAALRNNDREFQQSLRARMREMDLAIRAAERENTIRIRTEIDEERVRQQGGFIARALAREIRQNGALIVGAIAAALALGAPAVLVAASGLFAGIGAAAAFQSDQLRQTWVGLWDEIKTNTIADGAVLIGAFERMAGAIGESFRRMRPMMRDAFEAVGPQIDSVTASLLQMAETVMPSLVRAVEAGGPAIRGFGEMVESIGVGFAGMVDRISSRSEAAGESMSALGDNFAALLPLIGEMLAQGSELAVLVLPVLASVFQALDSILVSVGGSLPAVLAGFLAFRVIRGLGRMIAGWGASLTTAAAAGGMFTARMQGAGGVLSAVGRALPVVGIAVGAVALIMARATQRANDWTQALIKGGNAAEQAIRQYEESRKPTFGFATGDSAVNDIRANILEWLGLKASMEEAREEADRLIAAMTPLERAQRDVGVATRELEEAMADENTTASDLRSAKQAVSAAAARQAREEDKLERATSGVTEAMKEQIDVSRARVDAAFAYEKAVDDLEDVLRTQKELLESGEASAEDLSDAARDVAEAYYEVGTAASDKAMQNLPSSMTDAQKATIGAKAELEYYRGLLAQGVDLPDWMDDHVRYLESVVTDAGGAALAQAQLVAALSEVGVAVEAIPDTKAVRITDTSPEVLQRLRDLNFTVVTLEDGTVVVEAKSEEALAELGTLSNALAGLDGTVAEPAAEIRDAPLRAGVDYDQRLLETLDRTTSVPEALLRDYATSDINKILGLTNVLGGQKPRPTASVNDQASGVIGGIVGRILGIPDRTVTITTVQRYIREGQQAVGRGLTAATGGAMEGGRFHYKFDGGGEVIGRGSGIDDLVPARGPDPFARYSISNGEHVLDARDVALMGGQQAVYAFRDMLNSGSLQRPTADAGVRQMVTAGAPRIESAPTASTRDVRIYTQDNPRAIVRAMRAEQQQAEALAPVWP